MRVGVKVLLLPVVPALGLLGLAAPSASAASIHKAPAIWVPHVYPARAVSAPRSTPDFGTKTNTYVTTAGTDSGACQTAHPCATISYAESQTAVAGTIHVAAGKYNQSANLTQPVHLVGAGANSTTIDGSNVDYAADGYYGVLAINNNSGVPGTIAISGLTVTNPFITAAESAEDISPVDVANMDQSTDTVTVSHVTFGPAQDETDYPGIGYYSLNSQSTNRVESDTASGMFQAYFAEGSGAKSSTFTKDTASGLVAGDFGGTEYPAVGLFALADTSDTLKVNASTDTFSGYDGDGLVGEAGYSLGNCTQNVCTGGVILHASHNIFALTSAPKALQPVAAITMDAGMNDSLTATLAYSSGTVARPDKAVITTSGGGTLNVTDTENSIKITS